MQLFTIICALLIAFSSARTIKWTAAGGNPLWNNAGNWDCRCLPTTADDVIIDIQSIPGYVQIGGIVAPALCKSLRVGGTSSHPQHLNINGPINIGSGKSALASNGEIVISSGPATPVSLDGTFDVQGRGFAFVAGKLAGKGTFNFAKGSVFNLTGAAAKTISTNVNVDGTVIAVTTTATDIELQGGSWTIGGSFATSKSLSISTDPSSSFHVKGKLTFTGSELHLAGNGIAFDNWYVGPISTVTINNAIKSGTLDIASGGKIDLIGGAKEIKQFTKITGKGIINQSGGTNTIKSATAAVINAAGGNLTVSGTFDAFRVSGAFVTGGKVSATSAYFTGGFLVGGTQVVGGSVSLSNTFSLVGDSTSVTVGTTGYVESKSLLALTGGSSLKIAKGAVFKQTADFQIVSGAPQKNSPSIVNDGQLNVGSTTKAPASLQVAGTAITGAGSLGVAPGGSVMLNNLDYTGSSIASLGSMKMTLGKFKVSNVSGKGSFTGNAISFTSDQFEADNLVILNGNFNVTSASIASMQISSGKFLTSTGSFGSIDFQGGEIASLSSKQGQMSASLITLSTAASQTITNMDAKVGDIVFNCGSAKCQFFATNSKVHTN